MHTQRGSCSQPLYFSFVHSKKLPHYRLVPGSARLLYQLKHSESQISGNCGTFSNEVGPARSAPEVRILSQRGPLLTGVFEDFLSSFQSGGGIGPPQCDRDLMDNQQRH